MVRPDENNHPGLIRPANIQGATYAGAGKLGGAGMGQTRRALSTINRNIVGVPPPHPCAVRKRTALSENDGVCNKNLPAPANRPITRKFAAQMANKQPLQVVEEPKKAAKTVQAPSKSEDCIIVDVEDYESADDFSVPMFVQHTMHMIEETDSTEEVEMEDVDDEEPLDIDGGDKHNPLAVVEYIEDLYAYYKKAECSSCVPSNYMVGQVDINERMRAILVDWLIEVHYKFELMEETLYLTVNLIDRFLAIRPMVRKKLQLVGVTAMLLACKYEEVSVPVVEDLILISDRAYSRKEVLEMEKMMVNTLQFKLSVPTPYVFMRRFLKAAESDKKMELLAFFIIELCLVEYQMLKYPPSLLAAAAVFTAQCSLTGSQYWSPTCEKYTSYSEYDLMECSRLMVTFHQKAGTGKLTGVYRKYSSAKYGYAAKSSEAACFLLDDDFEE